MPDKDGYPTKKELLKIKKWSYKDPQGHIAFIKDIWWMSERGIELRGKRVLYLDLHTLGWSGNEDIIAALRESDFWILFWRKHIVGGHYYFRIDLDRWKKAEKAQKKREEQMRGQADE